MRVAPEVRAALDAGRPVVALESTIIAHGLPWPQNLEIGRALEDAVRDGGATPATIAVVDGEPHVGLGGELLERLAKDGASFRKAGAADLAVAIARRGNAATTVSATAFLAARAGIRVFATGGIGGVHRRAPGGGHDDDALDVSSDLTTLATTPVAVVSAGAKAILDLPRTAEMLETLGVLVLGLGTDELPAFYTRRSGIRLEHRVETAAEAAAVIRARFALGQGGVLVANPIPAPDELDPAMISAAIDFALAQAAADGVRGKALTPFLLRHLASATAGAATRANRALALHNARVGAAIACAL